MTLDIKSLHTPFREQMKTMDVWLRDMIQTESKKTTLGQQVEVMMGVWNDKRKEIEDGHDALRESKVKIKTGEYEADGNDDPHTFITLSLYLPQIKEIEGVKQVIEETDLHGTFDLYSQKIRSQHEQYWRRDLLDNADNLRWNSEVIPPKPGFQWETISMGTNRNEKPRDMRYARWIFRENCRWNLPHIGIYASAATHPNWIKAMNGKEIPFVWAAGLDVRGPNGLWNQVPYISFVQDGREVGLSAGPDDSYGQELSIALLKEGEPLYFPR